MILCINTGPAWAFLNLFSDSVKTVQAVDGLVSIDATGLSAGESQHYQYRDGDRSIRFFLARDGGGGIRAALDACEVCWRENKGYKLDKGAMLCVNCGQRFNLARIGQIRGGCNPHPIAFSMKGAIFAVTVAELMSAAVYNPENAR